MKTIFSIILFSLLAISPVMSQSSSVNLDKTVRPISVETFTSSNSQVGNTNYRFSLSDEDFAKRQFVFYTDSNATVAYLKLNGFEIKMNGGPNPEHIWAYTCKGFTVTLSIDNTGAKTAESNEDDHISVKATGTLVVYNNKGQVIGNKVTGVKVTAVKN